MAAVAVAYRNMQTSLAVWAQLIDIALVREQDLNHLGLVALSRHVERRRAPRNLEVDVVPSLQKQLDNIGVSIARGHVQRTEPFVALRLHHLALPPWLNQHFNNISAPFGYGEMEWCQLVHAIQGGGSGDSGSPGLFSTLFSPLPRGPWCAWRHQILQSLFGGAYKGTYKYI